jgi:hypothetical protein
MTRELGGWDAYTTAVVGMEAPGGVIWLQPAPIARTDGQYPDPDGRPIYVITAHNPAGRLASEEANAAAQARLESELRRRGLTWWPAAGGDPSWTHVEASVALAGIPEADAITLGAEFKQDAIFAFTPADRRIVSCTDERVVITGWAIAPLASADRLDPKILSGSAKRRLLAITTPATWPGHGMSAPGEAGVRRVVG